MVGEELEGVARGVVKGLILDGLKEKDVLPNLAKLEGLDAKCTNWVLVGEWRRWEEARMVDTGAWA